jgi:hypothetical protein
MAERRVPDIVGEAQSLGQVLVEGQRPGDGSTDLGDFEAVGEPDPEMVPVGSDEDLGLVAEPPERDRVDDPVAVPLESVARPAPGSFGLAVEPPPRPGRIAGQARKL